jgi:Peptidase family C54.
MIFDQFLRTNLRFNINNISQLIYKPDNATDDKVFILGKEIRIDDQNTNPVKKIEEEVSKIIWFSYRKNFPILNHQELKSHETYISDTCWGCMIRSCQMALAAGIKRSLPPIDPYLSNIRSIDCDIISWFLDTEVDPKKAPYSIQTISKLLYDDYKLKPGIWLKPSNVLLTIDKIQHLYGSHTTSNLQIEVFLEGTIYINQVLRKAVSEELIPEEVEVKDEFEKEFENIDDEEGATSLTVLDSSTPKVKPQQSFYRECSIYSTNPEALKEMEELRKYKWKGPLMLFVLAKIGLEKPNPEYFPFIKKLLAFPESIGMIGINFVIKIISKVGHQDRHII